MGKINFICYSIFNRLNSANRIQTTVFLFFIFFVNSIPCHSKGIEFSGKNLPPHRIIRTCCSFGTNVEVMGFPNFYVTEITGVENIGAHHYMGSKEEGNGIIYTLKGGFIDMAHLRDQADWTAYMYSIIITHKGIPDFEIKLGYEGGMKKLHLNVPPDFSDANSMNLAGRIAYDLSVWHEIATWYGASSIPFVPERYSSFSLEDNYSNLLGAIMGIEALKSDLPYEEAMTKLIHDKLIELERVDSVSQTYDAMEKVVNKWWTRNFKFPQSNVLLKREYSNYSTTYPLIVPGLASPGGEVYSLDIPKLTDTNYKLEDVYTLSFRLNGIFHFKNLLLDPHSRTITSRDFLPIIDEITLESNKRLSKISKIYKF
jgi:hypothetical protein